MNTQPVLDGVRHVYDNVLRERLPTRPQTLRGVSVPRQARLFDQTLFRDDHEPALIDGIHRLVEPGDRVLILGGGYGVSAVHAAIWAGQDGHVEAYEATSEMFDIATETIAHAPTPCPVEFHHAAIGEVTPGSAQRFGPADGGRVRPEELPECDVLVVDIEGAEREVLPELTLPGRVVIEAHEHLGSPVDEVVAFLEDAGFETEDISAGYDPDVVIGRRR